jgi:hypothetical protein
MNAQAYILTQDRFGHQAGTKVYRQRMSDYGLANDDSRITGIQHITVTLNADGGYPGFTVPVNHLTPAETGGAA